MAVPISDFAVHLRAQDNVAVARKPIPANTTFLFDSGTFTLPKGIGMGHKFALVAIKEGDPIRKYGQVIGFAGRAIAPGEHVHVHNVSAGAFERDYAYASQIPAPLPPPAEYRTFMGYDRGPGKPDHQRYGTRNYLAVISTVNCSASTSKYIADRVRQLGLLKDYPNVDGVIAIVHRQGCGMQFDGPDHQQLDRTLAGFARHPNVASYLLVGLGCEIVQASHLINNERLDLLQLDGSKGAPLALSIQECGGIGKTVEAGVKAVAEMLPRVNDVRRVQLPAKHLILGTNCGGSDGNSGVTANPALGVASDLMVQQGGASVLGETTEIYGAEHILTRRAVSKEVGEKLVERIKWWEWYTSMFGAEINNNPSPGNKEGGLTTIYEKSLGAIAKAGTTAMVDVYRYAEPVTAKGFVVMDTPGYDPVSMTGIVAGGANVCVFTTGRGSVFGCKPAPCVKVATNTPLYTHMIGDMDIDAGKVLTGTSVEAVGQEIFEKVLSVASGERTKSELNGVGEEEFAPWSIGPTL
ncbi:D-galactarate dehydratase [Gemmata obscuriglobus]|uniref:Altronate dehydratase n=1 Tax=Gemmata obscuriglobus TaxID=114 RepID=A0A2Z3GWB4_9BACT|nr:altronate dehydratase family protein [Gemmata obscuriglobus]AWM38033.1 altronate dehydratase [Gemmata obscuriglobus]QEG29098.1 D-galactarate dehydratase [Gemmata obscuriglobus]VTS07771.1 galactarate dehydratase : Altronate dehydratase OS=Singulisphaera acidiphila (strain ATCC BAA-1392 / DSM 18658 / VKM B-2454 / MOB10) GN=Sinac_3221 PE=4 SV=1: SAF: GD_AH_C [Gemmata obscuriglobus UQM 2246]